MEKLSKKLSEPKKSSPYLHEVGRGVLLGCIMAVVFLGIKTGKVAALIPPSMQVSIIKLGLIAGVFGNSHGATSPMPFYTNPLLGKQLFIEKNTQAAKQADEWRLSRPKDAAAMDVIANESRGVWIGSWNADPKRAVQTIVQQSNEQHQTPVLVAYNVPSFSCESYIQNPSKVRADYLAWLTNFASGIGTSSAVVILEPDALAGRECLFEKKDNLMRSAVELLKKNPATIVYIDAGHGTWNTLDVMARKLLYAGIDRADGFALNVSNFQSNKVSVEYGTGVSKLVNGKHFVIDTSRNGDVATPLNYEWCNPRGRALGSRPTTSTSVQLVDAFMWIKQPGESDGTCNGGPEAGLWWPEYALELVQNATTTLSR